MGNHKNTVKDFLLNPEFRKWVFSPNPETNRIWEQFLIQHPGEIQEVEMAKEILLDLFANNYPLQKLEFKEMWDNIEEQTKDPKIFGREQKIIPIHSVPNSIPTKKANSMKNTTRLVFFRIAAILLLVFSLGISIVIWEEEELPTEQTSAIIFKEHHTPLGVKSRISLKDGTKVLLNSGSKLKYEEDFSGPLREVYLKGEAFFEVAKDTNRPFIAHSGGISTTALGTSFNIKAYQGEYQTIALLSGKVEVKNHQKVHEPVLLEDTGKIKISDEGFSKVKFDKDKILGWTKKTIVFDNTELSEIISTLENWYGVSIIFQNKPRQGLYLSGKFYNESLENVMEGLKHTAKLDYEFRDKKVNIKFYN